jgi:hypothetical protein
MMLDRAVFGYVVAIDGPAVTLNLRHEHRGFVASHRQGISGLLENGSLFGVSSGSSILILRVLSLQFAEPKEVHFYLREPASNRDEPLRNMKAVTVGRLIKKGQELEFYGDALASPALGAEAFPLTDIEQRAILCLPEDSSAKLRLGTTVRGSGALDVTLNQLLPRHVAVLGGTGQGKSCFTAAMLQQMLKTNDKCRIVVFDINGEYEEAIASHCPSNTLKVTRLGGQNGDKHSYRIPYYALGRAGLSRLLLPSEKTQRPALNFALEALPYVRFDGNGAGLADGVVCLYDDCRAGNEAEAWLAIEALRSPRSQELARKWPHMSAVSCLVADSQALRREKNRAAERNAFHFGHIATLVDRIHRKIDDPMFRKVVNVEGGDEVCTGGWEGESSNLIQAFFGAVSAPWKVHLVDLRLVTHDLLPGILGAMLELYAYELFQLGQDNTQPTLLVLEEAHHYLRSVLLEDGSNGDALAYERLAKEGRKFNLALWISTQRPSEVSSTVLSQCGTWICFRLTGQADIQAVTTATEWLDRREISAISGLPRQHAVVFGAAIPLPCRVAIPEAVPTPKSKDPRFEKWNSSATEQVKK